MADFAYIDKTFINLYSEENPILEAGDECYFLFTNIDDIHRPLVGRGIIIKDIFLDDLSKTYYIQLVEFMETPAVLSKFVFNGQFSLYPFRDEKIKLAKLYQLNQYFTVEFFTKNLFKIEGFFIRDSLEKINDLRASYIKIIRKDLEKQIQEIDDIS